MISRGANNAATLIFKTLADTTIPRERGEEKNWKMPLTIALGGTKKAWDWSNILLRWENSHKRTKVHHIQVSDFFDYDQSAEKLYINFTGRIKHNYTFSIENEKQFFTTIKECNHSKRSIERHNCIKSGFERDERFLVA